jgi:uroporphyrinogen-III synthase
MSTPSFHGLRVLILESRRAQELASIVTSYGGAPISAPSMREVPLHSNPEAVDFADALESQRVRSRHPAHRRRNTHVGRG